MRENDFIHLYISSVSHISTSVAEYIYFFLHFFWCFTVSQTSKVNMEIIIHNYRRSIKYMRTMSGMQESIKKREIDPF